MLVSIDDLSARLPFVMDADETREAEGAVADLSFEVSTIGSARWTTPETTPQAVKNLILRAAARHMKNYEGYTMSRAGDETVQWAEQISPGSATFAPDEVRMLRQMGGTSMFIGSVPIVAWGTRAHVRSGLVPVDYAPEYRRSDFPLFAEDEDGLW